MSDTQSTEKIKSLSKNRTWNINDVTWILLGHECSGYFGQRISSMEPGEDYWDLSDKGKACFDLFDVILGRFNSGRFGRLLVECMDEFDRWTIHRLRVVDWINDTEILESVKFKENHHLQIQKKLLKLFEAIDTKRPDKNEDIHKIDFVELLRSDFWVLTELRIVLFGETYLGKYQPHFYQKFIPEIEDQKKKVDQLIESALILGEVKKYASTSFRQPLITYIEGDDYIDLHPGDAYIGVYDSTELETGCKMYKPIELLKVLQSKGYPILKKLTELIETEQFQTGSTLLRELPRRMDDFIKHGPREPAIKTSITRTKPSPTTRKGKMNHLREKIFSITKTLVKKSPTVTSTILKAHSDIKGAVRDSGLDKEERPKDSTLEKWIRKGRQKAGLTRPSGRPQKS